ncbi:NADH-quinone oxidoreductase subunit J [Isosphaeraceae bacterium EP7]
MNIPTFELVVALLSIALGAVGTSMLLPHQHGRLSTRQAYTLGGSLVGASILLLALLWKPTGFGLIPGLFFYVLGIASVAGAILSITSRDPIYSALWFAWVVLSTSGLFLLAGAQFLAAGTIIVYAGAIIVTFLFVIMLAQKEGQATYDRSARSPFQSTFCCFLLLWSLTYALLVARSPALAPAAGPSTAVASSTNWLIPGNEIGVRSKARAGQGINLVLARSLSPTSRLNSPHVAGLGGTLYTDHLVTIELAGALLFVGLVGAVAIAAPKPQIRPANAPHTY